VSRLQRRSAVSYDDSFRGPLTGQGSPSARGPAGARASEADDARRIATVTVARVL
jgi:hypothetical protein